MRRAFIILMAVMGLILAGFAEVCLDVKAQDKSKVVVTGGTAAAPPSDAAIPIETQNKILRLLRDQETQRNILLQLEMQVVQQASVPNGKIQTDNEALSAIETEILKSAGKDPEKFIVDTDKMQIVAKPAPPPPPPNAQPVPAKPGEEKPTEKAK